MIFEEKFNNSLYVMLKVDPKFEELLVNFVMDLPTNIIYKVQKGYDFIYEKDKMFIEYEVKGNEMTLDYDNDISDDSVLLTVYGLDKKKLDEMVVCEIGREVNLHDVALVLGGFEFLEDDFSNIYKNYTALLIKFEDCYQIMLIESSAEYDEDLQVDDLNMKVCNVKQVQESELLEILNRTDKNIVIR